MASVNLRELLEAGVHFGHQTRRWNPKMKPYIFTQRNGIYIVDLRQTVTAFRGALDFLEQVAAEGGEVLFVGTKRQAQDAVEEAAARCAMYHVNQRWLGGLLTNFETIRKSVARLKDLEAMAEDGRLDLLPKKEAITLRREQGKLMKNLSGIKEMDKLPDAVFIVDVRREHIAVREAMKLNIPIVAIVDTNCDPEGIDFVVPGNDDALRAIRLFTGAAADAIQRGRDAYHREEAEKAAAEAEVDAQAEEARAAKAGDKKSRKKKKKKKTKSKKGDEADDPEAQEAAAGEDSEATDADAAKSDDDEGSADAEAAEEATEAEKKAATNDEATEADEKKASADDDDTAADADDDEAAGSDDRDVDADEDEE